MKKSARKTSTDPVQEKLRADKDAWNQAAKEFINRLIAFKRGINGRGDTRYSLDPGKIENELPESVISFLPKLVDNFNQLAQYADKIKQEQKQYSLTRKKPNKTAFSKNKSGTIKIGNHSISTVFAISDSEKERGLMYLELPPPSMTFLYTEAENKHFWMKNTPSPLDIIFCRSGRVISIHDGNPFSTKLIGPGIPSDIVIEMPSGTCNKLGIKVGDSIDICT